MAFFEHVTQGISPKSLSVNDQSYENKTKLLKSIQEHIKDKNFVFFNYSGHGVMVRKSEGGKWNGKDMEWALLLPSDSEESIPGSADYIHNEIARIQEQIKIETQKNPPDTESLQSLNRWLKNNEDDLKEEIAQTERGTWKHRVITQRELAELFRAKNVAGIVEACHSGALSELPQLIPDGTAQLLTACSAKETAKDRYTLALEKKDVDAYESYIAKKILFMKKVAQLESYKHRTDLEMLANGGSRKLMTAHEDFTPEFLALKKEALDLSQDFEKIQQKQSNAVAIQGGLLANYLASLDAPSLDTNKDGILSIEEIGKVLPSSLYHDIATTQSPQLVTDCSRPLQNMGFPLSGFDSDRKEIAPLSISH